MSPPDIEPLPANDDHDWRRRHDPLVVQSSREAWRFGFWGGLTTGAAAGGSLVYLVVLASVARADPLPALESHYAPAENLEQIDTRLIAGAQRSIDMAAYTLTSWPVVDQLIQDGGRGVAVRLYLDRTALDHLAPTKLQELVSAPGLTIRYKRSRTLQHLKSYLVDGQTLRAGAANFSDSGLKRQDNDLWIIRDAAAAARFQAEFERIWKEAE